MDDHCPFCLKFSGLADAREAGGRFCPECGADWDTLDSDFDAPEDSVVLTGDHPAVTFEGEASQAGRVPDAPALQDQTPPPHHLPVMLTPEATDILPPERPRSAFGPVTIGLVFALAATVAVGFVYQNLSQPEPAPRPSPVAAAPQPAKPTPKPKAKPEPPKPKLPSNPDLPTRRIEAVEQAIELATQHLPAAHTVKLKARVRGAVTYLGGEVDSRHTLDLAQQAAARVFGIEAVDTRDVRIAFRRHTLKRGDTLSEVARHYYGDPGRWVEIWKANQHLAARPDAIVAGASLLIPTPQD